MAIDIRAVCDLVQTVTGRPLDADRVSESTTFLGDLGLTSIQTVDLIMKIEERFGVEVEDTDLARLRSIGQVMAYLDARDAAS